MTRTELNTVAALKDADLLPLSFVETASLQAMVKQGNDADARVEAIQNDNATALKDASDKAAADLAAAEQKRLNNLAIEKIANDQALADAQTKAALVLTNAVNDLTAQTDTEKAGLIATITKLQIQLTGSKGSYKINVTFLHQAALDAEAAINGKTAAEYINDTMNGILAGLSRQHMDVILQTSLGKYPSLSAEQQKQLLGILGLSQLAKLDVEEQLPILATTGILKFQALESDMQNAIIETLGISSPVAPLQLTKKVKKTEKKGK